jgi:hypothetical protein
MSESAPAIRSFTAITPAADATRRPVMSAETQTPMGVLEWCLPVIHDCLNEFYQDLTQLAQGHPHRLTERHFTLWSALARDDFDHLAADRKKLAAEAESLRLDFRTCRAADLYVADEIFKIILRRFRRMDHEAHANHCALLDVLTRLREQETLEAAPAPKAKAAPVARAA